MTHKEIHQRIPDYVLDLLTPVQADEVAQHLAGCTACRRTVKNEREIGALVRTTLRATTHPDEARLRQLMPAIPQKSRQGRTATNWTTRLAPALVLLIVIVGSLLMTAPDSKRSMSIFFPATVTAPSTNTPTATLVLLIVIVGSLLMTAPDSKRSMSIFFPATVTATSTNTPTATVAQDTSNYSGHAPVKTERLSGGMPASELKPAVQVMTAPAPLLSPTPIAAIGSIAAN
jgi:hypothetical protein